MSDNQFQHQLHNLQRQRKLLAILVLGIVVTLAWVMMSIFSSQQTYQISAELRTLAKPITPDLNNEVLERIEAKHLLPTSELEDFPIYKLIQDEEGTWSVRRVREELNSSPGSEGMATSSSDLEQNLGPDSNQPSQHAVSPTVAPNHPSDSNSANSQPSNTDPATTPSAF